MSAHAASGSGREPQTAWQGTLKRLQCSWRQLPREVSQDPLRSIRSRTGLLRTELTCFRISRCWTVPDKVCTSLSEGSQIQCVRVALPVSVLVWRNPFHTFCSAKQTCLVYKALVEAQSEMFRAGISSRQPEEWNLSVGISMRCFESC